METEETNDEHMKVCDDLTPEELGKDDEETPLVFTSQPLEPTAQIPIPPHGTGTTTQNEGDGQNPNPKIQQGTPNNLWSGLIKRYHVDIIALQETKVSVLDDLKAILGDIVPGWVAAHNFDIIMGERMVVCWNPVKVDIQILNRTDHLIHLLARCRISQNNMLLSFVYGLYTVVNKRTLWNALDSIGLSVTLPWLCMGDYNAYLTATDKSGGTPVTDAMIKDFGECCTQNGLVDLRSTGFHYTWSNKHIWCKLDRALVNQYWLDAPFTSSAEFLSSGPESDHSPCVVTIADPGTQTRKPFRFFNMWTSHPDFQNLVRDNWNEDILGTRQFVMSKNLKLLKSHLKLLNKKEFSHIMERADRARKEYAEKQMLIHNDQNNITLWNELEALKTKAIFLDNAERSFYSQKAKCFAVKEGDRCTKFFHSLCKRNMKRNYVPALIREDGSRTGSNMEVLDEFVNYYQHLLGTRTECNRLDETVFDFGPCIDENTGMLLAADVTPEEIREAVFSIHDEKAPGPDGYSAHFFKKSWHIVGSLLTTAVMEFFETGQLLKQWNATILTMIPKSSEAQSVTEFRPIACCNVVYKVIPKILSARLAVVLEEIVGLLWLGD